MCILKLLCVYVCYTINKDQSINQSALYVCLSSRSYRTNFGEFLDKWDEWLPSSEWIWWTFGWRVTMRIQEYFEKTYHCEIATTILLITVDEILWVFERWDVPIAKDYLIFALSRIQQLLAEFFSTKNGQFIVRILRDQLPWRWFAVFECI